MSQTVRRYIFRFIHQPSVDGWTVRDTLSGVTMGHYASEDDAVFAALRETRRHSEFRYQDDRGQVIPLL
jgi:hypothetical protein